MNPKEFLFFVFLFVRWMIFLYLCLNTWAETMDQIHFIYIFQCFSHLFDGSEDFSSIILWYSTIFWLKLTLKSVVITSEYLVLLLCSLSLYVTCVLYVSEEKKAEETNYIYIITIIMMMRSRIRTALCLD